MEIIDKYFEIQKQIYDYFGYKEDWVVIPIDDRREMFWSFDGIEILYAENENDLRESGEYYANTLYRQRFLSRWVYKKQEFTMICVDTHVDGNKFLAIFSNEKRILAE